MAKDENAQDGEHQNPAHIIQKEAIEAKQELKQAISNSHEVLYTANTVFPLTLFPDTVTIDREKVTITQRDFFMVSHVVSTNVEDILNVTANVGPFFGSLVIVSRYFERDKPFVCQKLWRDDALKLKRIIHGYIIAIKKDIDVDPLDTKELAAMLTELGEDVHT